MQELRKPALPAWAVNQLARRHRKEVDLLLDAGNRLTVAQRALTAGAGRDAFDDARGRLQESLARLVELARELLGERASATTLERVMTTLRAAALSDEARPALARGRLTADVEPTGFDALAGAAAAAPPARRRETAGREAAERRAALERARAELKAARERESELAKERRAAERTARAAAEAARRADDEVARLEADEAEAARAVEAARLRVDGLRGA